MLEICLVAVLAIHLLCLNVASAGPLVCLWLDWRSGRGDALAGQLLAYLARMSLILLLVGAGLGGLVGYLVWSPSFGEALLLLSNKVFWGVWEIVFSVVIIALYLGLLRFSPDERTDDTDAAKPTKTLPVYLTVPIRIFRRLCLLLTGTNLLYHFPYLFAVIADVTAEGAPGGGEMTRTDFLERITSSELTARASHFILASFAMCGVLFIGYALKMIRQGDDQESIKKVSTWGGRIALTATLLQIPVGIWLIVTMPGEVQDNLTGGDLIGTTLLIVSIMLSLGLLHKLAAISFGETERRTLIQAMAIIVVVVVLMTGVLRRSRPAAPRDQSAATPTVHEAHL